MRKHIVALAVVLPLALPVGGCALLNDIGSLTTTIPNPVGPQALADVERAYQAALGVANVYVELCRSRQLARASCRPVVTRIQSYVAQAHAALVALRGFVRNNDTINATTTIAAARAAIADFQNSADYQTITLATSR